MKDNMSNEQRAIDVLQLLNAEISHQNDHWKHSEVENWKVDFPLFSNKEHIESFRKSFVSAGVLNPPDRPYKINKKYDGLAKDLTDWFGGIRFIDKLRGAKDLVKRIYQLNIRLRAEKIEPIYKEMLDDLVGNPCTYRIPFFGKITDASIRYWYYSSLLNKFLDDVKVVMEVGSGYGGLSQKNISKLNVERYYLVDLPENMVLAYYYHLQSGNRVCVVINDNDLDKIENHNVVIVAPWMLDKLTQHVDLLVNTMSFQHMTRENIDYYFSFITKLNVKHFYHVNRVIKRDPTDIVAAEYPVPDDMQAVFSKKWYEEGFVEQLFSMK